MSLDLTDVLGQSLPATLKGLASQAVGGKLESIAGLGLSLLNDDLPFPVAVLKESALSHNLAWMQAFVDRAGVELCPHGKTTMAPQLFDRQLQAGSWGMAAATASHVRTYRRFGVRRILLANQLVGRANIDLVFDELEADPEFDFFALVDSIDGLDAMREALVRRPQDRPIQLLLEVGTYGGRTGVRTFAEGVRLGEAVKECSPAIALRGIEAFEGVAGGDTAAAELTVHAMLAAVCDLAQEGVAKQWFAPGDILLSAGGSAFFDLATSVLAAVPDVRVVLRSGCYLTHDAFYYHRMQARMRDRSRHLWGASQGLQNALEVWSVVASVPERSRAIVALGKRDISFDLELPQPLWWFRRDVHDKPQAVPSSVRVTALNDQHAYVDASTGETPWRVGDLVGFGVGHPCTTFDKWPLLYTVDDSYRILGGIRTFF